MRRNESLYAVIGGVVGAIVTMTVCSVMPIGAQNGDATFGEITCTGLKVVDTDGNSRVWLTTSLDNGLVYIEGKSGIRIRLAAYESAGGQVSIRGTEGEQASLLTNVSGSAEVFIHDRAGGAAYLSTEHGGLVKVYSGRSDSRRSAVLGIDEHGGYIAIYGKGNKKSRAIMAVNEYGNGTVSTWDKNSYRLATLK